MEPPASYASAPKHSLDNDDRLARITAEFRAGYELLETIEKGVTFFGSARVGERDDHYEQARTLSRLLAVEGFTTITGGGPGIMEAANRGAVEGGARSIGFSAVFGNELKNSYVQEGVTFYYLFVRKVMLASAGHAYVFFPGGFGTLDEFFEISTLIHTHKLHEDIPVVLIGRPYWESLIGRFLKEVAVDRYHAFEEYALGMWTLVDSAADAFDYITSASTGHRLYGPYHQA